MKYSHLVGKLAGDKNSKKLGKIIGIIKLPRKNAKEKDSSSDELTDHLLIQFHRFFKKDIGVPIDCGKIIKIDGNFVWINILVDDFKKIIDEGTEIINIPKGNITENSKWNVKWNSFLSAREKN